MRLRRHSVKDVDAGAARRLGGSFLARLKEGGQFWLDLLKSARQLDLGPALTTFFLLAGVGLVFVALMIMPILGLAVAGAAAVYIYATRDQYLPVRSYNWKKDYDPARTSEPERAQRAGYRSHRRERARAAPLSPIDLFNRIAVLMLVGVGGPIAAVAKGPFAGMVVTFTLAVALMALTDPNGLRPVSRRARR